MNITVLKNLKIFITRSIFVLAPIFLPACSMEQGASYGVMLVCVDAIAGAPEEEYHIL